jgi:superfamily II DNA or RNA helicase
MISIPIQPTTLKDYDLFIKCKKLPKYQVKGNTFITDELSYNYVFKDRDIKTIEAENQDYLFDYQEWVIKKALERKNYAAFLECGYGKTLIQLNWCKAVSQLGKVLLLCPLAVMNEFKKDNDKFTHLEIANLRKGEKWDSGIAIMNYESLKEINMSGVIGICLDESGILKNGDGVTRKYLQDLQSNCEYRLACSATPSPNEQAEYATHAVFLNQANTLKEYYSRYFRKDGTRWLMKGHAENDFYENLSSWACYINDPESLGFEKGGKMESGPEYIEINTPTKERYIDNDYLIQTSLSLSEFQKIAGKLRANPNEPRFQESIKAIKDQQSIIWCIRNNEQDLYSKTLKNSVVIDGKTPIEKRVELINQFKAGNIQYLISKPKVLGFGVNLQEAESHLYSGYDFSFEAFYQAIRRSHRYGRKGRLKVYIPIADIEYPVYDILRRKLETFENDINRLQAKFKIG